MQLRDISADYACLALQGPNARAVLEKIAETDVSAEGFAFGLGRYANVAGVEVWLQRLSYVGELGWEIFVPAGETAKVFAELQQAGAEFDIRNVGLHAVNSLRLEKGFRHWGHDIGAEDNLFQAGLSFAAKPDAGDFIGTRCVSAGKKLRACPTGDWCNSNWMTRNPCSTTMKRLSWTGILWVT